MAQPATKASQPPQASNLEDKSNKEKLAAEFPSKELTLLLFNGMRLAGKAWGPKSSAIRVLALHGWLDNAATWDGLAPILASRGIRVVAIDFFGHGRSPHLPITAGYTWPQYIFSVLNAMDALNWDSCHLVAHSMGAGIASVVAGVTPDRFKSVTLVEGLGPIIRTEPTNVGVEIEDAWKAQKKNFGRQPKVYCTIDECIKKLMSNNNTLAEHSAKAIVKRSTSLVPGGVAFTHDPRLVYEKQLSISEEDTRELFKRINCPVLLFWTKGTLRKYRTPKKGDVSADLQKNSKIVETLEDRMKCINFLLQVKVVEGSHHVHLDDPERIADDVLDLLIRPVAKL
eukprot:TRINITY_DN12948_c0_g1_i1.p1 TRINITY_DN12948_c0_g1~~TRINITY_DN12948_c0_g1_i1.p1  ORF type:complete len:348 (+),score=72.23 TRINITY_DN12948_c0_g1_i1:23-1045(+)